MNIRGEEKDLEVPSSSELQGILEKYHDQIGHPGINSSVKSIKQRYHWHFQKVQTIYFQIILVLVQILPSYQKIG